MLEVTGLGKLTAHVRGGGARLGIERGRGRRAVNGR